MSAYFPFFPVWLADVNHLTKTETGIVFSSISLFAIIFQPVFGLMSDKLGCANICCGPLGTVNSVRAILYFRFLPAAADEYYAGSLVGGIYLGIVFSSGSGAVEAYIERVSRATALNMAKCGSQAASAGAMRLDNRRAVRHRSQYHFWIASGFALVLGLLLWLSRPESSNSAQVYRGAGRQSPGLFAAYGGRAAAYAALLGLYRLCGGCRQRLRRV
ncbi:putative proton/sugar symporter, LacY [Klebsiella pneumoniae]|uniref:Putative proton/sugar symporter, LacY n=1 Tax=Klebsiella pneumoniae TaxID=573 RepID=A0A377ZTD8_KLEPN|nr:putative proton/sugar symporter, LacY [Klebsiella pneumoniae]